MVSDIDVLEGLLRTRHSCRAFRPEAVPDHVLDRIFRAAQHVPSWCNAQPWQVLLADPHQTDALRQALSALSPEERHRPDVPFPQGYSGPRQDRRRACGWQLYEAVGVAKGDRDGAARQAAENFRFFGAPQVAIVTSAAELGAYGVLDCGAFVTAVTLAARALGVATIAQASIAGCAPTVRAYFAIPEDRWIVCAIAFGYADDTHPANAFRTARADLSEVVERPAT